MAPINLTLLGGFAAIAPDGFALRLPAKARALVAYLALTPDTPHPRDTLATLLWGDSSDVQARDSLRHALAAIRRACNSCGAPEVRSEAQTIALDARSATVDARRFRELSSEASPDAWREAAALYRGPLLDGLPVSAPAFEEWLQAEREAVRGTALDVLGRLLVHEMSGPATRDAVTAAVGTARRILAIDPLQEGAHRALMRLYAEQDHRSAALRQYQHCVVTLRRELGTEPEAETRRLYEELLQRRLPDAPRARRAMAVLREIPDRWREPLVGRDAERTVLRRIVDQAAAGSGQVIVVTGEAGIGKTALLRALRAELDQAHSRVMPGRSHASTGTLPFAPWIDAFRCGGVTADDEAVSELDPVWRGEMARLLPELAAPGFPPPNPQGVSLFEGVAELIRSFARRELIVITMDDMHWGDEASLRLLAYVARRVASWRAVIAVTTRADRPDSAPLLDAVLQELRSEAHTTAIRPRALSEPQTTALVRARMQAGGDAARQAWVAGRVWAISRGNPFVAIEALRAIQETTIPGDAEPTNAQRLVQARLSRLSEPAWRVLEVAATIGHEFAFALAQEASGLPREVAAAAIEELVRHAVFEDSQGESGESFDFTHQRIREVASDATGAEPRRMLHERVARALERVYPEEGDRYSMELAHHYEGAEDWAAAVTWLRRAAMVMTFRSAYGDAASALDHARALTVRLADRGSRTAAEIDVCLDRRNAHLVVGELQEAAAVLARAEALAEESGDIRRLARIVSHMSHDAWVIADGYPSARKHGERAFGLAQQIGDEGLFAEAAFFLGSTCVCGGDYPRAIEVLEASASRLSGALALQRFGLPYTPSCTALAWLAWALTDVGRTADALALIPRIENIANTAGDAFTKAVSTLTPGLVLVRSGRAPDAVAPLATALKECTDSGIFILLPYAAGHLGLALAHAGQPAEGAALLREVVAQSQARRFVAYLSRWTSMLGEALLLDGDVEAAGVRASEALELARRYGERGNEACAEWLTGAVADARGDASGAAPHYAAALTIASALGMQPLAARVVSCQSH